MRSSSAPSRGRPRPGGGDLRPRLIPAATSGIGKFQVVAAGQEGRAGEQSFFTRLWVALLVGRRLPFRASSQRPGAGASWFRYVRAVGRAPFLIRRPSHPADADPVAAGWAGLPAPRPEARHQPREEEP